MLLGVKCTIVLDENVVCKFSMISRELAALRVLLLSFLVKVNADRIEILALRHQIIQVLTSSEDVIKVLMHNFLNFKEFLFYFHQFVGLVRVLPFDEEIIDVIIR